MFVEVMLCLQTVEQPPPILHQCLNVHLAQVIGLLQEMNAPHKKTRLQFGNTDRPSEWPRQSLFAGHIKHISALHFRQVRLASSGLHVEHSWNTFRRFSAHITQRGICNKVLFGQYVYCFLALSIIRNRIYYTFVF